MPVKAVIFDGYGTSLWSEDFMLIPRRILQWPSTPGWVVV